MDAPTRRLTLPLSRLISAVLHVGLFFAATAWGFGIGHDIAGAALGMLMGLNSGVCAVLLLNGAQNAVQRWRRPPT